ncbi:hypothetical protein SAMN05421786_11524 [Chryseobacterium ureilyticum]|uniref:Uncharacterized protein n=1 Tax=Chryseobacterium ureilyticum TaxID=373668 RepID=A0A1N7QRJ7_9FLAO|nr:hypothetical protein [Chryseobacterium ureilyticum]SIT25540.1 hypothetical protein SAMN05421786_11524 [Chryseobacterium ureilyticum]
MEINGYEYTEDEVLEALKKKGYLILKFETYNEEPIHGSTFVKHYFTTKCAVKGNQLPSDENIWFKVAEREFEKPFFKPDLAN